MEVGKMIFLSKWVIYRFHVNLTGCKTRNLFFFFWGGGSWQIATLQSSFCPEHMSLLQKTPEYVWQSWNGLKYQPSRNKICRMQLEWQFFLTTHGFHLVTSNLLPWFGDLDWLFSHSGSTWADMFHLSTRRLPCGLLVMQICRSWARKKLVTGVLSRLLPLSYW